MLLRELFSKRELEIWEFVSCGFNNACIADELCIETKTVEKHISNLIAKTKKMRAINCHPRTWLALKYREESMFLIREPWKYDFVEVEEGMLIVKKSEVNKLIEENNIVAIDSIENEDIKNMARHKLRTEPWTFTLV